MRRAINSSSAGGETPAGVDLGAVMEGAACPVESVRTILSDPAWSGEWELAQDLLVRTLVWVREDEGANDPRVPSWPITAGSCSGN